MKRTRCGRTVSVLACVDRSEPTVAAGERRRHDVVLKHGVRNGAEADCRGARRDDDELTVSRRGGPTGRGGHGACAGVRRHEVGTGAASRGDVGTTATTSTVGSPAAATAADRAAATGPTHTEHAARAVDTAGAEPAGAVTDRRPPPRRRRRRTS